MEISHLKTDADGHGLALRLFGPNTELVLAFLAHLSELTREDAATVAEVWRETDGLDRAEARAWLHRRTAGRERQQILAAAAVARREAQNTANRCQWRDWSFWAAASDAAAAITAPDLIGCYYPTLVAPLSAVMPFLQPAVREIQRGKGIGVCYLPSADALALARGA